MIPSPGSHPWMVPPNQGLLPKIITHGPELVSIYPQDCITFPSVNSHCFWSKQMAPVYHTAVPGSPIPSIISVPRVMRSNSTKSFADDPQDRKQMAKPYYNNRMSSRSNELGFDSRTNANSSRGIKRQLDGATSPIPEKRNSNSRNSYKRPHLLYNNSSKDTLNLYKQDDFDIKPSDVLNGNEWDEASKDIWDNFKKNRQTVEMYECKMRLRQALYCIVKDFFPFCSLFVVGSSMNGFGSNSSDMDMCLMLSYIEDREIDQRTEASSILSFIGNRLSSCCFVQKAQLVQAKVPILKFTDCISSIDVDLNVNNDVGIRNTQLLKTYSRMDWRVAPLVLIIKNWAQWNKINDAKNMTLSSYSLVLMVLHYLQNCSPQIIPCLQKMMPDKFHPLSDVRNLPLHLDIPNFSSKNQLSLGELLLGFFDYYSNKFSFDTNAISVRNGGTIAKQVVIAHRSIKNSKGQWKFICIEEPFDHTNTARSVYDEKEYIRILDVFKRSYKSFKETKELNSIYLKN